LVYAVFILAIILDRQLSKPKPCYTHGGGDTVRCASPGCTYCSLSSWFTSSCAYHLSQSLPWLLSPITPSTFHSRLKTHVFHKSFSL